MGNFSRNTFNPDKNYVGVRLQQGVPLVDADWNELDDAIRNEVYSGLGQVFPDGIEPGSQSLRISATSPPANNLTMAGGAVLVGGRPLRVPTAVLYNAQPWFDNPNRAAQDGVAVIPPLTLPSANRTDIVYLDVWEREVRSTEDDNLIHPDIGVETCVRLKREFAFRVAEGTQTLPVIPAGHSFVPLALLNRLAGQANILLQQIEDIRPQLFSTQGRRAISFFPAFLPLGNTGNPWFFDSNSNTFFARTNTNGAIGFLPLDLPEGASLLTLHIVASTASVISFSLLRRQTNVSPDVLAQGSLSAPTNGTPSSFDIFVKISDTDRLNIVDNSRYYYLFHITNGSTTSTFPTSVTRIFIRYQY